MLAKLIATLLQAKAGVISGVFLLGATGALISVSASNGVTTVTITEASPTPTTAVTRPVSSPELNVTAPASPKAAESPKVSTDSTACSAEAQAIAFQVQRVNSAFSGFHTDLEKLQKDHSKDALKASDKKLKEIRKAAVKAIHATRTCKDDEDKDEDASDKTSTSNDKDENNDEDKDEANDDHKSSTGSTFSGTASAIADQAIAAMKVAFDAAAAAPVTPRKPEGTKHPEGTKRPDAARTPHPTEAQHRD